MLCRRKRGRPRLPRSRMARRPSQPPRQLRPLLPSLRPRHRRRQMSRLRCQRLQRRSRRGRQRRRTRRRRSRLPVSHCIAHGAAQVVVWGLPCEGSEECAAPVDWGILPGWSAQQALALPYLELMGLRGAGEDCKLVRLVSWNVDACGSWELCTSLGGTSTARDPSDVDKANLYQY